MIRETQVVPRLLKPFVGNLKIVKLFNMLGFPSYLNTFDLFMNHSTWSPVFIVSDSEHEKLLKRRDAIHIKALEKRKAKAEEEIKLIESELASLAS